MKNKMRKYTDKYFLRANEILKTEKMNPWVNMQVFVRRGPGKVSGVNEAIDLITQNSNLEKVGGRIYVKKENALYVPKETIMNILVPIQEIMELETVYLGVLTAATSRLNDGMDLDFNKIGKQMRQVVELAGDRPVLYFGARHWHYDYDSALANLAFENGCKFVATDNGAAQVGKKGSGTIPHALENIYAYYYEFNNAVIESTKAFDRHIDPSIPRVALVDYANREIEDSIRTAESLEGKLNSVRVDTCGENLAEGGIDGNKKYWEGTGVSVEGVYALRKALDNAGYNQVGITLSSGFSNPEKVKVFNDGEKKHEIKLYDAIGAGFLDGPRTFTSDVIAVGESVEEVDFYSNEVQKKNIIHKVGRPPRLNKSLERII
jgi:nicotinate phosphoribosyltransferase